MNIKEYIEDILVLQEETDAVILEISKIGSQLFRSNPTDLDYIITCRDYTQRIGWHQIKEDGILYDFFILDVDTIASQQNFEDIDYINMDIKLYAYTSQVKEIIYGGYTNEWNMFDHEKEYKQYIKKRYTNTSEKTIVRGTGYRPGKFYVHYYIILKIYENKVAEINEDMIKDVRLLYTSHGEDRNIIIDWVISKLNDIEVT